MSNNVSVLRDALGKLAMYIVIYTMPIMGICVSPLWGT
jgi:hypothetical protein